MNISTATTAELVAYYNQHAAKPVKKFSDRKTAQRRVAALMAASKPVKKVVSGSVKNRSASIVRSWQNKKVAAARATRHGVVVCTPDGKASEYKSVREAFMVLALPLGQHIRFRGALKAAGKADFGGCKFKLVEEA